MAVSCKNAPKEEKTPIGVQLYSVRGDMAADFYGTLKAVKEMGYDGVEFAGLFGNTPEQVKAWCEELELNPISAHVPLADMTADIDAVINAYKTIGCKFIAVPYLPDELRPGAEQFEATVKAIAEVGAKVKDAGMTLLYHNHDFEFKTLEDGTYGLDYLYENVPAELLQTELDLCWVKYAGVEPAEYLRKYSGRAPVVHFKDYFFEGAKEGDPYALIGIEGEAEQPKSAFEFRPVGSGVQDVPALLEAFKDAGSQWIIVEQDEPSMGLTPMQSIRKSLCNLHHMMCPGDCCKDGKKECCKKDEGDCCKEGKKDCCDKHEAECEHKCCGKKDCCDKEKADCCEKHEAECEKSACDKCDKAEGCEKSCCE